MPIDIARRVDESEWDKYGVYLDKMWAGAFGSMQVASEAYFGHTDIWADLKQRSPGDYNDLPNFNPGIFASKVEQAVASQLSLIPTFHREPTGGGAVHDDMTGPLEKGLSAVVEDSFKADSHFPTIENGKQLFLFNHTQRGVFLDAARLERPRQRGGERKEDLQRREWEWESSKEHWNPIRYVVPTPGEVLMEPMESSPGISIWRRELVVHELADLTLSRIARKQNDRAGVYQDSELQAFDLKGKDAYEPIKVEWWFSPRWVQLRIVGGKILLSERNQGGIQPFSQAWGGNAIGKVGESFDLKWWVEQAMLFRALPTLMMYAQSKWARHELLMRRANAAYRYDGDVAEGAEELRNKIVGGKEGDWGILPTPDLIPQAYQEEMDLVRSLEAITFSPLAVGMRENEAETATGVMIRAENVEKTFKPLVTKLSHLEALSATNTMKLVWKTSEILGKDYEEIGIGKNKLRIQDMGKPPQFHIQASFENISSVVAMQELQRGQLLYTMGLVGDKYMYRLARIEDGQAARMDAVESLAWRDPEIQEQLKINAWREMGQLELADKMQAALDQRIMQRMTMAEAPVGAANGKNPLGERQGVGNANGQRTI